MRKITIVGLLTTLVLFTALPGICAEPQSKKKNYGRQSREQSLQSKNRKRIALVIGNGQYSITPLTTARNDAHVVAATLRRIGFEVEEKADLKTFELKKAVATYSKRAKKAEIALFYFNGHVLQLQGDNYLIPAKEKITNEKEARAKAVPIDLVIDGLKGGGNTGIVVLDAGRSMGQLWEDDPVSPGLAPMQAPDGTIIAFAAPPDATVPESIGSNGIYAETLAQALDTPGLTIGNVFRQVRLQIEARTARAQTPWESNSMTKELVLVKPFDPDPALSQTDASVQTAGKQSVIKSPQGFTDTFSGIEFVSVPGGCFPMGDIYNVGFHWEKPVHIACVSNYSIGKYEVTQGQWKWVMGKSPSFFNACGEDCPVEQVSWNDVQEFILKLNLKTGGDYRLPTEAEWEYAARSGGKIEMFSGGNDPDAVAWHNLNSAESPHKVGSKQANGLGIHDMSGNVWEWVQDWYGTYNSGRQLNPIGPTTGNVRVFRGGSWSHGTANARTSIRYYNTPETRINFLGFRIASPAAR